MVIELIGCTLSSVILNQLTVLWKLTPQKQRKNCFKGQEYLWISSENTSYCPWDLCTKTLRQTVFCIDDDKTHFSGATETHCSGLINVTYVTNCPPVYWSLFKAQTARSSVSNQFKWVVNHALACLCLTVRKLNVNPFEELPVGMGKELGKRLSWISDSRLVQKFFVDWFPVCEVCPILL